MTLFGPNTQNQPRVAHPDGSGKMVTKQAADSYTYRQNQPLVAHPDGSGKMVAYRPLRLLARYAYK